MKQRKKRRTKNSDDERLFLCGCKKRYLSYAALYTHTKKIHDGVFPEGTLIGSKREPFLSGKSISSIKIKQMLKRSEEDGNTFSKKSRR